MLLLWGVDLDRCHRVLDGEVGRILRAIAVAASGPVLAGRLIEHGISRDMDALRAWVVHTVRLGPSFVSQENHW